MPPLARAHKRADPFYLSSTWRALRIVILKRDGYRCVICKADVSAKGAARIDHIKPRSTHPELAMEQSNLRTLCTDHDNQIKERTAGQADRKRGGVTFIRGSDADGMPLDPSHPWAVKR